MKRALYTLLFIATLGMATLAVSCKKETTEELQVPSNSILVSMPGEMGTTYFTSYNIASISAISTPKGWEVVNINMYTKSITVKAPEKFDDGEEKSGDMTLKGYTPLGENISVTIYLAILEKPDVDYTNTPANCYIANKAATRFLFNPMIGGSSTPLNTERIELIWESDLGVIKYIDMQDGVASFYIQPVLNENDEPTDMVRPGNALIGAYDADDNLLWTWHIWITNSDPTTDTITIGDNTLMNINLGANLNSNGEKSSSKIFESYGLYYQWGRRTPFIGPETWNFQLNNDKTIYTAKGYERKPKYEASSAECGTVEWANNNPMYIITGNKENCYDWLYEGHEALWSANSKSEHDPCPAGWRIPDSSIYANLTISDVDDNLAWTEAQGMYGWNLVDVNDSSKSYFFTAQGRRNYLDGRLDIVNDDATRPIPWAGYYWTASSTDEGMAKAMFFDLNSATRTWNGFDAARSMQRANALPVRCVKE